ncbi:hypothetical protein [Duganella qianjiadongensis]|uniref:DUF922 domain-containing protein n=1 Tax=Duganella qianjiadongensis TaxID=2692176 RepID=A0ABW9VPI3_9BURK|nr:hypothetical protein [Duganella qianjiadongensis]MYM40860.1 hypothetical protein [Duganella qianjiadongensis]
MNALARVPLIAACTALAVLPCAPLHAAAAGTGAASRTPFQVRCEDSIAKTVSVLSSRSNGYTINNQLPFNQLTARSGSAANGMATLGLTVTNGQYGAKLGGTILQDPASGYECIAPRVDLTLNYSPVLIYVSNEFAPGSCGYQVILEHEQRHLQAYMENLARVEKVVRDALNKRFDAKPLYAPSGTAMSALEHEINTVWFPFIRDEFDKGRDKQAQIDTAEEYARMGKVCNGEIAATILKRLHKQ